MGDLMEDDWVRDVTRMIVLWMFATALAGGLMLAFGETVFL